MNSDFHNGSLPHLRLPQYPHRQPRPVRLLNRPGTNKRRIRLLKLQEALGRYYSLPLFHFYQMFPLPVLKRDSQQSFQGQGYQQKRQVHRLKIMLDSLSR